MGFDVKKTTKISVLDLLMPYTCRGCGRLGSLLCECCKKDILQPECKDEWIYAVGRREGALMRLTEEYKYKSIQKTAEILTELMALTLKSFKGEEFFSEDIVVVPLPTISKHIRERGFDHTDKLAKKLAKKCGFSYNNFLLKRAGKTVQVGADAKTRKAQAKKAYELSSEVLRDRRYLLLDDISTTGASLSSARKILEDAGVYRGNIFSIVVCIGLNDD